MSRDENSRRREMKTSKKKGHQTRRIRGGKNIREGKSAINITYIQKIHKQGEFYAQKVL